MWQEPLPEGLAILAEAQALVDKIGGHCYEAELHWLKGELLRNAELAAVMNVEIEFSGSVKRVEALVRFLKRLQGLVPRPVGTPKVVTDDGVIYVEAGFATDEENWQAGEKMAQVGAEIVEDTDVLVVLAPYTVKAMGQ